MLNLLNKYFCQFFLVIVLLSRLSDKVGLSSIEFHNLNTAISSKDKLIIDAHTTVFHKLDHISNMISFSLEDLEISCKKANKKYNLSKLKQIITYCLDRNCNDSNKLWHKLQFKGFSNIVAYKGGWQ